MSDDQSPKLWSRMRALADSGHDRAADLRTHADALEAATAGFFAETQTVDVRRFMGSYARAKRLWSECSGEPLVSADAVKAGAGLLSVLQTTGAGRK